MYSLSLSVACTKVILSGGGVGTGGTEGATCKSGYPLHTTFYCRLSLTNLIPDIFLKPFICISHTSSPSSSAPTFHFFLPRLPCISFLSSLHSQCTPFPVSTAISLTLPCQYFDSCVTPSHIFTWNHIYNWNTWPLFYPERARIG